MFRIAIAVIACAIGQAEKPPPEFADVMQATKDLGPWEEHAGHEANAMNAFFERNEWNSEADQYALELMLGVNEVPPWDQQGRMDTFLSGLEDRYGLSADQRRLVSRRMVAESMRIAWNHHRSIMPVAMEALTARANGEPVTAEQVARWSKALEPVMEEAREAMGRVTRELSDTMTEAQQKILKEDYNAFDRRHRDVMRQVGHWQNGEWTSADWGMDNDPIQHPERLTPAAQALQAAEKARRLAQQAAAKDSPAETESNRVMHEDAWARYVREFAAAHRFSDEQRESAEGILKDLRARARQWRAKKGMALKSLEDRLKNTTDAARRAALTEQVRSAEAPLEQLFEELKGRLRALPTAEQRALAQLTTSA
ncbi:MAG: hypothetical protein V3T70_08435 [Phycisphaerae bacterium]